MAEARQLQVPIAYNLHATGDGQPIPDGRLPANLRNSTAAGAALVAAATAAVQRMNLGLGNVDNTSDLNKPVSTATQSAINAAVTGLFDIKGATDASTNPNYPVASKGDAYVISVAGKIGGAAGVTVEPGDVYISLADNAGGTQAAVGALWEVIQSNIVGALISANNLGDVADVGTALNNLKQPRYNSAAYSVPADGVTDARAALAALDALGTHKVLTPGTYLIASPMTFTGVWEFRPGAMFKAGVSQQLTIQCDIVATGQIFDLSLGGFNSVVFDSRSPVGRVNGRWYGMKGNGQIATGVAMTAGSAVVTRSGRATFAPSDVGKIAVVPNAGTATPINLSSYNAATDVITTSSAHGLITTTPLRFKANGGTVGGLVDGTIYYARVLSTTTFYLFTTAADSLGHAAGQPDPTPVNLTGTITGTPQVGIPVALSSPIAFYDSPNQVRLAAVASETVSGQQITFVSDDTAALAAAVIGCSNFPYVTPSKRIYLPAGIYGITTLSGEQHFGMNIQGDGPHATVLSYIGQPGGTALFLTSSAACKLEDLAVDGNHCAKYGLLMTDDEFAVSGVSILNYCHEILIQNCTDPKGWPCFIGTPPGINWEVSENTFGTLYLDGCFNGVKITGQQTIGIVIQRLLCSSMVGGVALSIDGGRGDKIVHFEASGSYTKFFESIATGNGAAGNEVGGGYMEVGAGQIAFDFISDNPAALYVHSMSLRNFDISWAGSNPNDTIINQQVGVVYYENVTLRAGTGSLAKARVNIQHAAEGSGGRCVALGDLIEVGWAPGNLTFNYGSSYHVMRDGAKVYSSNRDLPATANSHNYNLIRPSPFTDYRASISWWTGHPKAGGVLDAFMESTPGMTGRVSTFGNDSTELLRVGGATAGTASEVRVVGASGANGYKHPLYIGSYGEWVDSVGARRLKNGTPGFDTDGSANLISPPVYRSVFASPMTLNASSGVIQTVEVFIGTNFTFAAPSNAAPGQVLTLDVLNSSGGAMGAITWDPVFKTDGTWTNPGNGRRKTIHFYYDGTNWIQTNELDPVRSLRRFGAKGDGTTDDAPAMISAVAAAANGTLVVEPGTYRLSNNVTIGSTVNLVVMPGALFSVDSTFVLTISNGGLQLSPWQGLVTGAGVLVTAGEKIGARSVKWFNAKGDGVTDDRAAFNSASNNSFAATRIDVPEGTYAIGSIGVVPNQTSYFRGAGMELTTLKAIAGATFLVQTSAYVETLVFEDMTFDANNIAGITGVVLAQGSAGRVMFRRCRFRGFPGGQIAMQVIGAKKLIIKDCVFEAPGDGTGQMILLGAGCRTFRIRGNVFRYFRSAIIIDTGSTTGSEEQVTEIGEISGNYFDGGWWLLTTRYSGSGGTVTYTSTVLTDTGANFAALGQYDTVRVMPVLRTGTGTFAGHSVTDASATYVTSGVKKGHILRTGAAFAVVLNVESETKLWVEEWMLDSNRYVTSVPANGAYTVYGIYLSRVQSNTATVITISRWYDLDGATVLPTAGTRYEVLPNHPNYPTHMESSTRLVSIHNNVYRRGWSDQISVFGNRCKVMNNFVESGQDMGITLQTGFKNEATGNHVHHQGACALALHCDDSIVANNEFSKSGWENNDPQLGDMWVLGANRNIVDENQFDVDGGPNDKGITVVGVADSNTFSGNKFKGHTAGGVCLEAIVGAWGATVTNTKLRENENNAGPAYVLTSEVATDTGEPPYIEARKYGAIFDGTSHPVSQWLTGGARPRKSYANLKAIQKDYPHVYSLTNEIDWAAAQKAVDVAIYTSAVTGGKAMVQLPPGTGIFDEVLSLGYGSDAGVGVFQSVMLVGAGMTYRGVATQKGTTIQPTFTDRPAIAWQSARMTEVRDLAINYPAGFNYYSTQAFCTTSAVVNDADASLWKLPALKKAAYGRYTPFCGIANQPYSGTGPVAWTISTVYPADSYVVNNFRVYYTENGGTSAGSGGPTGTGSAITDNTVTWEHVHGVASWAGSTAYTQGTFIKNGANVYLCVTAGTSAASGGPTGTVTTAGTYITDGTVEWQFRYVWASGYYPPVPYPPVLTGVTTQYNKSLSSLVMADHVYICGFAVGYCNSPNAQSQGDFPQFDNCKISYCRTGYAVGNDQCRTAGGVNTYFMVCHTVFDNVTHGYRGGKLTCDWVNLKCDFCIQLFNIECSWAGPMRFSGYGEGNWRLGKLGTVGGRTYPVEIQGEWGFQAQDPALPRGVPGLFLEHGASSQVAFRNGSLAGFHYVLYFGGRASDYTFDNFFIESAQVTIHTAERFKFFENFTCGVMFPPSSSQPFPRLFNVDAFAYNLNTGVIIDPNRSIGTKGTSTDRTRCNPAWVPEVSNSGEYLDSQPVSPPWIAMDKASYLTGWTVTGTTLSFTLTASFPRLIQMYQAGRPGDVFVDVDTGTVGVVKSATGTDERDIVIELLNNQRGGNLATAMATTGIFYFGNARRFRPGVNIVGDVTSGSNVIAETGTDEPGGGGARQAGNVPSASLGIQAGDVLYPDKFDLLFAAVSHTVSSINSGARTITMNGNANKTKAGARLDRWCREGAADA